MKLDSCMKLLHLFDDKGIEFGWKKLSFSQFLDLKDEVVDKILELEHNDQFDAILAILASFNVHYKQRCPLKFQLKVCDLLKRCESDVHTKSLRSILCDCNVLEGKVWLSSADMILNIKDLWRLEYVTNILRNKVLIRRGLSLEGAKLVLDVDDENKVWGICSVFDCKNTVSSAVLFEEANLILRASESFQVDNMAYLLHSDVALQNDVLLEGSRMILKSEEEYQAKGIYSVLSNEHILDGNIALAGAKMLLQTKEEYQANYIQNILCDVDLIQEGVTLAGSQMILDTESEEEAKRVRDYLDSIYPKKEKVIQQKEKDFKKMLSNMYVEEGLQLLSSLPSSFEEVNSKKVLSYVKKKDFK